MVRRSKEDAEKTRGAILEAAETLFAQKSVRGTSLEQIARKAGVTRGAVYWHFRDKTDLLVALRKRYRPPEAELMTLALDSGVPDVFQVLLDTLPLVLRSFSESESRQRMYQILEQNLFESPEGADVEGYEMITRLTRAAQDQGHLVEGVSPEEAALSLMALTKGLMNEWLMTGKAFDLETVAVKLISRHVQALRGVGPG